VHEVIASPYPEGHVIVRPGSEGGLRIPLAAYAELAQEERDGTVPMWLANAVPAEWHLDLRGRPVGNTVLVRPETPYGYARASYELNFGCNYDCDHCYLGEKRFAGLEWSKREAPQADGRCGRALDPTHRRRASDGPTVRRHTLACLRHRHDDSDFDQRVTAVSPRYPGNSHCTPPYRVTVSIYGATADSYDGLTRRPGSFKRFMRGVLSAHDAELPLRFNIVVTKRNEHAADNLSVEDVGRDQVTFIDDTDKLMVLCSCKASDDNPY